MAAKSKKSAPVKSVGGPAPKGRPVIKHNAGPKAMPAVSDCKTCGPGGCAC